MIDIEQPHEKKARNIRESLLSTISAHFISDKLEKKHSWISIDVLDKRFSNHTEN